jgi:hypothetical protein
MRRENQHDIWNPFGERVDNLSAAERDDSERARAWSYYANGGGGDPYYFDHMTWLRMRERSG